MSVSLALGLKVAATLLGLTALPAVSYTIGMQAYSTDDITPPIVTPQVSTTLPAPVTTPPALSPSSGPVVDTAIKRERRAANTPAPVKQVVKRVAQAATAQAPFTPINMNSPAPALSGCTEPQFTSSENPAQVVTPVAGRYHPQGHVAICNRKAYGQGVLYTNLPAAMSVYVRRAYGTPGYLQGTKDDANTLDTLPMSADLRAHVSNGHGLTLTNDTLTHAQFATNTQANGATLTGEQATFESLGTLTVNTPSVLTRAPNGRVLVVATPTTLLHTTKGIYAVTHHVEFILQPVSGGYEIVHASGGFEKAVKR